MEKTSTKELRKFGLSVGGVFLIFGAIAWYLGKSFYMVPATIGALLMIFGAVLPDSLNSVFYWWMKFAEKISIVSTYIILFITFFVVMVPIGFLLMLIRKDILSLKLDKSAKSYWIKVEEDSREERYITPY